MSQMLLIFTVFITCSCGTVLGVTSRPRINDVSINYPVLGRNEDNLNADRGAIIKVEATQTKFIQVEEKDFNKEERRIATKWRYERSLSDKQNSTFLDESKTINTTFDTEFTPLVYECVSSWSCRNRCNHSSSDLKSYNCYCDSHCTFFKDCCEDYERHCQGRQSFSYHSLDKKLFSCINLPPTHVKYQHTSYTSSWVVNKCPQKWKRNEIFLKCENESQHGVTGNNIRSHIPVIGINNTIFLNEYCAQCNGAQVLEYFGLKIICSVIPPAFRTLEETVEFVLKYCGRYGIVIFKKKHQHMRRCFDYNAQSCPKIYPDDERMPMLLPQSRTTLDDNWRPASFSVALDISRGSRIVSSVPSCSHQEFYDSYLESCRSGQPIPPEKDTIDKYRVALWFQYNTDELVEPPEPDFEFLFTLQSFLVKNVSDFTIDIISLGPSTSYIASFQLYLTNEETLYLVKQNRTKFRNTKQHSIFHVNNHTLTGTKNILLRRMFFFTKEFDLVTTRATFTVFKVTSRQLSCIKKQTFSPREYTLMNTGEYYINVTRETYPKNKVFFAGNKKNITVCENIVLSNCQGTRITLQAQEFTKFDNLSVYYNRTDTMYNFGDYDIENGSVMICVILRDLKLQNSTTRMAYSEQLALEYLTLIGFTVSVICLILVILTYVIFSELRLLPGKNILNLSVSLVSAQLVWLTAVREYSTSTVLCRVIAAVEHYLFVASFVAMAIIAFNTCSVVLSKNVSRYASIADEKEKFSKYFIIVWGLPAILVVACCVMDGQGTYNVYVNDDLHVCWFNNKDVQIQFFVIPVGLILIFNAIFFARTVAFIHRERARNSVVAASSNQTPKKMVWVYLRLSTLMGFSWIFGFLDIMIDSTSAFSYLFVIFASLQGLYIALAFLLNKRILKMYKKLGRKRNGNEKSGVYLNTQIKPNNTIKETTP